MSTCCIYVFPWILRLNSDNYLKLHKPCDSWNGKVLRFLWGTKRICKYYLDEPNDWTSRSLNITDNKYHDTVSYDTEHRVLNRCKNSNVDGPILSSPQFGLFVVGYKLPCWAYASFRAWSRCFQENAIY